MPDGWIPFENLWALAVLKFHQQSDVAWRMSPRDVWNLLEFSEGVAGSPKPLNRSEFQDMIKAHDARMRRK